MENSSYNFRPAVPEDLPQLKAIYADIIRQMNENNIEIWDEIYPCEFFSDDIAQGRLYLLEEVHTIVSAFALCGSNAGEDHVIWKNRHAKAYYIDRFGVNINYLRMGIGSVMLSKAAALAEEQGAEYLRLFVVDINEPAVRLYLKNGFVKAGGVFDEVIDEDFVLHEWGLELDIKTGGEFAREGICNG